ncbi:unnamed protein product [Colias eurytheme]|nr:unnamed protein product [Colias eurytheme]
MITPLTITPNILPKESKAKDVSDLLQKHFGQDWKNLPELKFTSSHNVDLPLQSNIDVDVNQPSTSSSSVKDLVLPSSQKSVATVASTSSDIVIDSKKTAQPNVDDFINNIKSITTKDGAKSKKITEAITNFIIMDNKPFSTVEGKGFRQLMKEALPPNKAVMADRGFKDLSCLLEAKRCSLIRPPSVSKSTPSTKNEVKLSKRIAALRIHAEWVIKRLREFHMLLPHASMLV